MTLLGFVSRLMLRECYCTVNRMLPDCQDGEYISLLWPEKHFHKPIFNHTQFTTLPTVLGVYPQLSGQLSTIYKSLAPVPKGNAHILCERILPLKFGGDAGKIRCWWDMNLGVFSKGKCLLTGHCGLLKMLNSFVRPPFSIVQFPNSATGLSFSPVFRNQRHKNYRI